jgi:hypothetical protein
VCVCVCVCVSTRLCVKWNVVGRAVLWWMSTPYDNTVINWVWTYFHIFNESLGKRMHVASFRSESQSKSCNGIFLWTLNNDMNKADRVRRIVFVTVCGNVDDGAFKSRLERKIREITCYYQQLANLCLHKDCCLAGYLTRCTNYACYVGPEEMWWLHMEKWIGEDEGESNLWTCVKSSKHCFLLYCYFSVTIFCLGNSLLSYPNGSTLHHHYQGIPIKHRNIVRC